MDLMLLGAESSWVVVKLLLHFVSCPSCEHNSKALSGGLHTDYFFSFFFSFFCLYPHCTGQLV